MDTLRTPVARAIFHSARDIHTVLRAGVVRAVRRAFISSPPFFIALMSILCSTDGYNQ